MPGGLPDLRAPVGSPLWAAETENAPDPFVVEDGDRWLAFSTNNRIGNVPVSVSTDELATWHGSHDALPELPAWADEGNTWAPSVVMIERRWVMYYSARVAGTTTQCIGVATSEDLGGVFTPALGHPLVCQGALGGSIDASVFTENGDHVLLWKNDGNCCGIPTNIFASNLTPDGLGLVDQPETLIRASEDWEGGIVEGPAMVRAGDRYHLFYSANWWAGADYSIGHAVCASPLGPCVRSSADPWRASEGGLLGPGGPETFVGPDDRIWLVHHRWDGAPSRTGRRELTLGPLDFPDWEPDEDARPAGPTLIDCGWVAAEVESTHPEACAVARSFGLAQDRLEPPKDLDDALTSGLPWVRERLGVFVPTLSEVVPSDSAEALGSGLASRAAAELGRGERLGVIQQRLQLMTVVGPGGATASDRARSTDEATAFARVIVTVGVASVGTGRVEAVCQGSVVLESRWTDGAWAMVAEHGDVGPFVSLADYVDASLTPAPVELIC